MLEEFASELDQALQRIMDKADLSQREREILLARWMHDGEPLWLEQVAKQRGVTRERIRQIEFKGLRKLREHKEELETLFEKRDQLLRQMEALKARMIFLDAIRWKKPNEKYQIEGDSQAPQN